VERFDLIATTVKNAKAVAFL